MGVFVQENHSHHLLYQYNRRSLCSSISICFRLPLFGQRFTKWLVSELVAFPLLLLIRDFLFRLLKNL